MKILAISVLILIRSTLLISAQQNESISIKDSIFDAQTEKTILPKSSINKILLDRNNTIKDYIYIDDHLTSDTLKPHPKFSIKNSSYIVPAALITYGLLTRMNKSFVTLDRRSSRSLTMNVKKEITIDNYTQYVPVASVYALDLMGVKAKHNLRDRTIVVATSYLTMAAIINTMKNTIDVWRPNHTKKNSFPSGHTATAFVGAHILFKEYKDQSLWIGVGGYLVASGTAFLRVYNRRHWPSDVITGAGIGILSAELGYLLMPPIQKLFKFNDTDKKIGFAPFVGNNNYGIGMVCNF